MLINDSLEIKLIDFEAAKKLSQDFQVDIATPGFTNDAVCNYEQQDWYAFAVIVHRLLFPYVPFIIWLLRCCSVRIIWCKSTLGMRQFLFFGLSDRECLA